MFFGKKELENKVVLLEAEINKLQVELEQKNKDLDNLAKKHSVELEEVSKNSEKSFDKQQKKNYIKNNYNILISTHKKYLLID